MFDVKIPKSAFNDVYLPYLDNKTRFEVYYGGAGSGKSKYVAQRIIYRTINQTGRNTIVYRKIGKLNRGSTFPEVKKVINEWGLQELFKINETDLRIKCVNGNEIRFSGIDDPEKVKSVTFENGELTDIWVEEASEIQQEDFTQLNLRLRGKGKIPKQLTLTFNPVSHLSWLKGYFFDRVPENTTILKTTYKDNRFLDEVYRQELENLAATDPVYYRIYALGEWGVLGNLILSNWKVEYIPKDWSYYDAVSVGVDFGFNHPSAVLVIGYKDGKIHVLDEIYERELTNENLIEKTKALIAGRKVNIIADCAEPARIEEFNRKGLRTIKSIKGPSSVRDGIEYLRRHEIISHPDCVNTIGEMQGWKYREDRMGNVLDEPVPFKDDAMAALRYGVQAWSKKEQEHQKSGLWKWEGPFKSRDAGKGRKDYELW